MCSSKANTLQFTEPRAANAVNAMTKDLQSCKNLEESSRWEISAHTESYGRPKSRKLTHNLHTFFVQ